MPDAYIEPYTVIKIEKCVLGMYDNLCAISIGGGTKCLIIQQFEIENFGKSCTILRNRFLEKYSILFVADKILINSEYFISMLNEINYE
jgi:hypothetical protein